MMHRPRLSEATLPGASARRPAYDLDAPRARVVHLGLGAFARGHLAVYLDDLLARGHHDVAIIGVSLRHDDVARALNPQDGLFTLGVVDGAHVEHRVIGSIQRVVHAPTEPEEVRAALASPDVNVVTVTVTEKGYCTIPGSRQLDLGLVEVRHDLDTPDVPLSLPGHLVLAARDRRDRGVGGMTVLSLDNLISNGRLLKSATLQLAGANDPALAVWIAKHIRFPCSMVDRMVPATTDAFRAEVASATGLEDHGPVRAELYSQWVVEGGWTAPMLPLDEVGVTLVDDVAPWEQLKLRVLNALHTSAAHYGLAHGLDTIDQVTADPAGLEFLERVAAEIIEVVDPPDGVDLDEYLHTTFRRFANAGLGHRCAQVATDTSQKLPQRFPDTIRLRLELGLPIDALADVLALWAWSTLGYDHLGAPRVVDDPLAPLYATIVARHANDPFGLVTSLLSLDQIFGDLARTPDLIEAVTPRLAPLLDR